MRMTFRLEAYLKEFTGTLIVVTHDRYFLSDVTDWILELDHGICYPYKGNYEEWLKQKEATSPGALFVSDGGNARKHQPRLWRIIVLTGTLVKKSLSCRQSHNP